MKIQYFIPIIGYFLMSKTEKRWRKNNEEYKLNFQLFEAYHFICVMLFNIFIVKLLFV